MAMTHTPSCRLLDLPEELFNRCMPACHDYHLRWTACKKLFSVAVAGDDTACLRLCLGVDQNAEAQRASLMRMVQAFPVLKKLKIHIDQAEVLDELLSPPLVMTPTWLANITDVFLSGQILGRLDYIWLDNFIPQQVADACPRLSRLAVQYFGCKPQQMQQQQQTGQWGVGQEGWEQVGQPGQEQHQQQQCWQPAVLPHLHELVLDHCNIVMQPDAVKQQLQALPSLQHMKLVTHIPDVLNRFSSTVTELVWTGAQLFGNGGAQLPYMQLRKLVAYGTSICQHDLKLFSKLLPSLECLEVGRFDLKAACSGELPALTRISIGSQQDWAGLVSLQHLLHSSVTPTLVSLCYRGEQFSADLSRRKHSEAQIYLHNAAGLLSAVQRVGGLRPQGGGQAKAVLVLGDNNAEGNHPIVPGHLRLQHVEQLLHTVIFIFHRPHSLTFEGCIKVNRALMTALGQVPSLEHLTFEDAGLEDDDINENECDFEEEVWTRMIPMLPQVHSLTIRCYNVTPTDVILLCLTAPRKVPVHVEFMAIEDDSHLPALEVAAKHSLVQLTFTDPSY